MQVASHSSSPGTLTPARREKLSQRQRQPGVRSSVRALPPAEGPAWGVAAHPCRVDPYGGSRGSNSRGSRALSRERRSGTVPLWKWLPQQGAWPPPRGPGKEGGLIQC